MRTLHLDQAKNCGWAIWEDGKLVDCGVWKSTAKNYKALASDIYTNCALAGDFHVTTIEDVREVHYQGRHGNAALYLAKLLGNLEFQLSCQGVVKVQNVKDVRSFFRLNTNKVFVDAAKKMGAVLPTGVGDEDAATAVLHGAYFWAKRRAANV